MYETETVTVYVHRELLLTFMAIASFVKWKEATGSMNLAVVYVHWNEVGLLMSAAVVFALLSMDSKLHPWVNVFRTQLHHYVGQMMNVLMICIAIRLLRYVKFHAKLKCAE